MNVPDGVKSVTAEGGDVKNALAEAARLLGLAPTQVDYKMDLSHFRSASGAPVARRTVKIVAWDSGRTAEQGSTDPVSKPRAEGRRDEGRREERRDEGRRDERRGDRRRDERRRDDREDRRPAPAAAEEPKAESDDPTEESDQERTVPSQAREAADDGGRRRRRDRGDRGGDRGDRGGRERRDEGGKPDGLRGAESGTTEASDFAQGWFTGLLGRMGVEGTVAATGAGDRVHLAVSADRAGRIVGKRGATLGSIRHLLALALETKFARPESGFVVDVDVGDDRPADQREARVEDRGERRDRGDRGDRGGRDRGGRGDRGGRDRGDRGGRGGGAGDERGRYPQEKLEALAKRAAEKAIETRQTITINIELNSFDRRIVHVAVGEIAGVRSQSEERTVDGRIVKYVQIIPNEG